MCPCERNVGENNGSDNGCETERHEWNVENVGEAIEEGCVYEEDCETAEAGPDASFRTEVLDCCAEGGRNGLLFHEEKLGVCVRGLRVGFGIERCVGFDGLERFEEERLRGFDHEEGGDEPAESIFDRRHDEEEECCCRSKHHDTPYWHLVCFCEVLVADSESAGLMDMMDTPTGEVMEETRHDCKECLN